MKHFVIYSKPADHPDHFVVREYNIDAAGRVKATDSFSFHSDLEAARAAIPEGLYCSPRYPNDDPVIVETWL